MWYQESIRPLRVKRTQKLPRLRKQEIEVDVHTDDAVLAITGDMEPCTGVYECWVPALQDV